jgi:hypothetical protein
MTTDPADRAKAIEIMKQNFVGTVLTDEQQTGLATYLVDQAIKQRGG